MSNEKWEDLYQLAVLEVDGKKMPERIAAARLAIRGRLHDLAESGDHQEERYKLDGVLSVLNTLEIETKSW